MTVEHTIRFFMQRPFEPLTLVLVDGRELQLYNTDSAWLGERAEVLYVKLPTRQVEVIDTSHIVSIRTMYASNRANWMGRNDGT